MKTLWTPPVSESSKPERIFGLRGSITSTRTMPFLRSEAPSRDSTQMRPSAETLTSLTVRASMVTVEIRSMFAGSVTSQKWASPLAPQVPVTA